MVVGVLGGTGQAGRAVGAELRRRGHRAIVLSRGAPSDGEHRRADVATGEGLDAGMAGLDAVVDVLNGGEPVLGGGIRRALAAAGAADVGHFVSLSAAGAGSVPYAYYDLKAAQEAIVRAGDVPWSIVRAAQFHTLLDWLFGAAARRGVLPLARLPVEPVDVGEVAALLADRVEAGPAGEVIELAGPRVERADRLARDWARARGVRRLPLPVPALGRVLRTVEDGGLIAAAPARGRLTFAAWLERSAARP